MIDTHAHVHDAKFDDDRAATIARAQTAGVEAIVTIGTDLADSGRAVGIATEFGLHAAIGIHPHEAAGAPADIATAFETLRSTCPAAVVAVGETGLDYYYEHSPRTDQRRVLIAQLDYARTHRLPLVFHVRDAAADMLAILREHFDPSAMRGVVHCFTGNAHEAEAYVGAFGLKLGIGGVLTFKTAEPLRDAVRAVGAEHLILETDCPYLAPVPHRGQRNEPAFMAQTLARLAEVLGRDPGDLDAITTRNARSLFGLPLPA